MSAKERLQKVFSDTFRLEDVSNLDLLTPEEIPEWDSLGHEYLITKITKEFKLEISTTDSSNLTNFKEILQFLESSGIQ